MPSVVAVDFKPPSLSDESADFTASYPEICRILGVVVEPDAGGVISISCWIGGSPSLIEGTGIKHLGRLEEVRRRIKEGEILASVGSTGLPGLRCYPILIHPNKAFLKISPSKSKIKGAILVCEELTGVIWERKS